MSTNPPRTHHILEHHDQDLVPESTEYYTVNYPSLPPKQADRVAMLGRRFAKIIAKAQQTTATDSKHDDQAAPTNRNIISHRVRITRKRNRDESVDRGLEVDHSKKQKEAPKKKTDRDEERKNEIQKQREAARKAINSITKTYDFDNLSVMKDFYKLIGVSSRANAHSSSLSSSSSVVSTHNK